MYVPTEIISAVVSRFSLHAEDDECCSSIFNRASETSQYSDGLVVEEKFVGVINACVYIFQHENNGFIRLLIMIADC